MRRTLVMWYCLTFIFLLVTWPGAFAQNEANTLSSVKVKNHFDSYFRNDSRLVSGDFYQTPMMSSSTGDPFFIDANWKNGSVLIDGINFSDIPLRYDVSSHQIILNTVEITGSYMQVILKKDLIQSFSMSDRTFISYPTEDPNTGKRFCELMVDGRIQFLVLKTKHLKVTAGGVSDYIYQESLMKNIRIDDEMIRFSGRKTLFRKFPEAKEDLKEYIRINKLTFRRMTVEQQAGLIAYCNTLISEK